MPQDRNLWAVEMRTEKGTARFGEPSTRATAGWHLKYIHQCAGLTHSMPDELLQDRAREWWAQQRDYVCETAP
jgi:hypothetical protein